MKKQIAIACLLCLSAIPAAHAQDKYNRTYTSANSPTPQTSAAPAPTMSSDSSPYKDESSSRLTGVYVGAYGGYGWADTDTAAASLNVDGFDYGVFAGYKLDHYLQDNFGINGAIEAHLGDSNADDSSGGASVEKDHEWGVSFRPGLSFFETFNPYGIIGYRRTSFDAGALGKNTHDGFDLGIGTEIVSWDKVGVRVDYTHTWFEDHNGVDPDENDVRVGLAYHW
jgi:outer membrane immunogenic protein